MTLSLSDSISTEVKVLRDRWERLASSNLELLNRFPNSDLLGFFSAHLLTFAFFGLLFPTDPIRHGRNMVLDLIRDLERSARATSDHRATEWEILMYNRLSSLIKVMAESGEVKQEILEGSFAVLDIGKEIIQLRQQMKSPALSSDGRKLIQLSLKALGSVRQNPLLVAEELQVRSAELGGLLPEAGRSLVEIANRLRAHQNFFRK